MDKPGRQRLKPRVKLGLTGCSNRGQSPAVKGTGKRNHFITSLAAVNPGQFDGGLIGLGAGVGHKDTVGKAVGCQQLGKLYLRLGMKKIGDMHQLCRLLLDRFGNCGMAVTQ